MAYIGSGKAGVLIVADLTRITRAIKDFSPFLEQGRFMKDGPGLISVQEHLDTRTAVGRLMMTTIHTLTYWVSSESVERVG